MRLLAIAAAWLLAMPVYAPGPARAQHIPAEWQAAAQAVIGEIERDDERAAARPWTNEVVQGWSFARAWRQHNNGNTEIILAEYLTFTALCRRAPCGGYVIEGRGYLDMAQQVRNLRAQQGSPYTLAQNAHAWLAGLADKNGAAAKNAALWSKDLDVASADFATGNLYALYWLLAQTRPTPQEQADTFSRFALFVQGKGWLGNRCLDISKVAAVLDAPPKVEACK
jgi:hypothetical protein